jgi:hypothetical protein
MLLWERAPARDQTGVDHRHSAAGAASYKNRPPSAAGVASHKEGASSAKKGIKWPFFIKVGQTTAPEFSSFGSMSFLSGLIRSSRCKPSHMAMAAATKTDE